METRQCEVDERKEYAEDRLYCEVDGLSRLKKRRWMNSFFQRAARIVLICLSCCRQATLRLRLAFRAPPFKLDCRSANQDFFFAPFEKNNNSFTGSLRCSSRNNHQLWLASLRQFSISSGG
ncbi:MAG: hypothetical protein IJ599_00855 [Alphaproteobacteria bacterium]|nr:hypothetical protein [Alphaproteobacteria bacterium]